MFESLKIWESNPFSMFGDRFCGTTRTQGTKIATEELKGRVLEVPIDLRARHFRGGETSKIFSTRELSFWTPKLVVWFVNVSPFPFGCIFRFHVSFRGEKIFTPSFWGKWSDLTNMFQIGGNHQLQVLYVLSSWCFLLVHQRLGRCCAFWRGLPKKTLVQWKKPWLVALYRGLYYPVI